MALGAVMIADTHELKAFVAMKIRVFALFGAVAVASFMLLSAPQAVGVLLGSIDKLSPVAQAVLRASSLALPALAAVALVVRQGRLARRAREDARRLEP